MGYLLQGSVHIHSESGVYAPSVGSRDWKESFGMEHANLSRVCGFTRHKALPTESRLGKVPVVFLSPQKGEFVDYTRFFALKPSKRAQTAIFQTESTRAKSIRPECQPTPKNPIDSARVTIYRVQELAAN